MAQGKKRGSITFFFLVFLVFTSTLGAIWIRVLGAEREGGAEVRELRRFSLLFHSAGQALGEETVLPPKEEKILQPLPEKTDSSFVLKRVGSGDKGPQNLCRAETLLLSKKVKDGIWTALQAERFEMRMPHSGTPAGIFEGTSVRKLDISDFYALSWRPIPDKKRRQIPLAGQLFFQSARRKVSWTEGEQVRGRGILVFPRDFSLKKDTVLDGDFRIFSGGTITVGENSRLHKVFLYSSSDIIIAKNSQVTGVLMARGSVQLKEGAEFVPDEGVLEPFRTPFIFAVQ